jgi:hypothetical protein
MIMVGDVGGTIRKTETNVHVIASVGEADVILSEAKDLFDLPVGFQPSARTIVFVEIWLEFADQHRL